METKENIGHISDTTAVLESYLAFTVSHSCSPKSDRSPGLYTACQYCPLKQHKVTGIMECIVNRLLSMQHLSILHTLLHEARNALFAMLLGK